MSQFSGKVVIVTGASRGIGRDFTLGFAKHGASVVVAARTEVEKEGLPGTIGHTVELINAAGGKGLAVVTDVTSEESVANLVKKTLDTFGRIDVMINNAGIAYYSPIVEMPLKRFELNIKVNLYGTFLCTRAVLPTMYKQKSGSIINISTHGRRTVDYANTEGKDMFKGIAAYETAKGAVEHFTASTAVETSEFNVAINCIKPEHGIATEGLKVWFKDKDWSGHVTSAAMVNAALFLGTQGASGVNGVVTTAEELAETHCGAFPWSNQ
jgi:NAD(P)-dependent dehydrogenase (short-subunit alcohol dehydrogenase family)